MPVLEINHVSKAFGDLTVIDDLNFKVEAHSAFGFIGKNGSGKTTTMKMILGFLKMTEGEVFVCGEKVSYGDGRTNRYIGYLPDVPAFYDYMTPLEYLKLCGEISGLNKEKIKNRSEALLDLVGLGDVNRRIKGFSRGMNQRLGIAQALLNEPKLLICDEPTSALDPVGRKEILDILLKVKEKTTLVFSTHILADVEKVCDRIGILDKGHLVIEGDLKDIKNSYRRNAILIELGHVEDALNLKAFIETIPGKNHVAVNEDSLTVMTDNMDNTIAIFLKFITDNAIAIKKFEVLEPTLENVFLEAVK